jgi:hypothetical protein
MLKLSVKSGLPLIAVTTRDRINLPEVLKEITGKTPLKYDPKGEVKPETLYYYTSDVTKLSLHSVYTVMEKANSTLILVNPVSVREPMFDAGEVPVPKKLVLAFMHSIVQDMKKASELSRALGGCTLKECAELASLTMAREGGLTVQGLAETRRTIFQGSAGLNHVNTRQNFYIPPKKLANWIATEQSFFLECQDHRLVPRGLLFDGPPGTGKTAGAKFVAERFGVPLYRVDIGGTKSKWMGASEANMLSNLARLDHEEPCVALFDEVEKVFSTSAHDTSDTTQTMLSQLLWWLAERRSRVLVIMTTNNASALPKELYRDGRIDQSMWFGGLGEIEAISFMQSVLDTFSIQLSATDVTPILKSSVKPIAGNSQPSMYSQAALTTACYAYVKSLKKQA